MLNTKVKVNLDAALETAQKGVRRAAAFMGLGLNAALDESYDHYHLSPSTGIEILPEQIEKPVLAKIKRQFAIWITGNGLRELIETFAVFLDQVFLACQAVAIAQGLRAADRQEKERKEFSYYGVSKKLTCLDDEFGVTLNKSEYLNSLQQARNCLTHRRGLVGEKDCSTDGKLTTRWMGVDIAIGRLDGSSELVEMPIRSPVLLQEGETIQYCACIRAKSFAKGEVVDLSPRDLAEICLFVQREARSVVECVADYAERVGVTVNRGLN